MRKVLPSRIGLIFHNIFVINYFEKNIARKLEFIAQDSDIIQSEFTWLYRIPHYVSIRRNKPYILTFHDINSDFLFSYLKPSDFVSKYFIQRLLNSELKAYNAADILVCFTEKDADELIYRGIPKAKIQIIPHGIAKFPSNLSLPLGLLLFSLGLGIRQTLLPQK